MTTMCEELSTRTEDFSTPPGMSGIDGKKEPTLVFLEHFYVDQIADLNCRNCTVKVKVLMWVKWFDPRLVNRNERYLPKNLWTPRIILSESMKDFDIKLRECHVTDKDTGQLHLLTEYTGCVFNPMKDIKEFPFDVHELVLKFVACEHMQRNEEERNVAFKEDYRLLVDSQWRMSLNCYSTHDYSGRGSDGSLKSKPFILPEWEMVGITGAYVMKDHVQDVFQVKIHIKRRHESILANLLIPLHLISLLGTAAYFMDNIGDILKHFTTLLLATFALLFVVASDLPRSVLNSKSGYTLMGQVTTSLMGLIVLFLDMSAVCYGTSLMEKLDAHTTEYLRVVLLLVGLPIAFSICALIILVPPYLARNRKIEDNMLQKCGRKTDDYYRGFDFSDSDIEERGICKMEKKIWQSNLDKAQKMRDEKIRDYESMMQEAQKHGIIRCRQTGTRVLSWEKWEEEARRQGYKLATQTELRSSGIDHGDMDFWNPVSGKDGEEDYVEMGKCPNLLEIDERFPSHQEFFGPFGWDKTGIPNTWIPLNFIYVKESRRPTSHDNETTRLVPIERQEEEP